MLVGNKGTFNPNAKMNIAEVITVAVRLNAKYSDREIVLNALIAANPKGYAWYQPYII